MKIQYLGMMLTFSLLFSCNDFLELKPPTSLVQDDYWQTKEQLYDVLMASYSSLADLDKELFVYGEVRADMVAMSTIDVDILKITQGNIEPDNYYAKWKKFYSVICYANYVLDFADLVAENDPTFSKYGIQTAKSEALFLRSLAYFYIVRIWKDAPLVLSAPSDDGKDFFVPKNTSEEIMTQIKKDMQVAIATPPAYDNDTENKIRGTKGAMNALMAEIALWEFNYADCVKYCDAILQDKQYLLMPASMWFNNYSPGLTFESIFEVYFDQTNGQSNGIGGLLNKSGGTFLAGDACKELINKNVGESWRCLTYDPDKFTISKYITTNGVNMRSDINSANFIIYRLADVILMKAEALSQDNDIPSAMKLVNEIRMRVDMPALATPSTAAEAEDVILAERAKEFAFEGKRWFDLMRMARRNSYSRKSELIEILIKPVPASQRKILAGKLENPYGWYFPIHVDEFELNTSLEQNPYYASFSSRE